MSWQPRFQQGVGANGTDQCGKALSHHLHCPVRFINYLQHPAFECNCNKVFPMKLVEKAADTNDWSKVLEHHRLAVSIKVK